MARSKDANVRRVYVLPIELADRITAYQEKKGYNSEVEAVRKLIEVALNMSEDPKSMLIRYVQTLAHVKALDDAAKVVFIGHPLVTDVGFHNDYIQIFLKDLSGVYRIHEDGRVLISDREQGDWKEINLNIPEKDDK